MFKEQTNMFPEYVIKWSRNQKWPILWSHKNIDRMLKHDTGNFGAAAAII